MSGADGKLGDRDLERTLEDGAKRGSVEAAKRRILPASGPVVGCGPSPLPSGGFRSVSAWRDSSGSLRPPPLAPSRSVRGRSNSASFAIATVGSGVVLSPAKGIARSGVCRRPERLCRAGCLTQPAAAVAGTWRPRSRSGTRSHSLRSQPRPGVRRAHRRVLLEPWASSTTALPAWVAHSAGKASGS